MTAQPLTRRHDFVLFFDVTRGNPNGDPDAGNMPRIDPETGHGLVSDVCLKRKVRNYVELAKGDDDPRHRIYVTEGAVLNEKHREAYRAVLPQYPDVEKAKKLSPKTDEDARKVRDFMCANFFDIRTFGGVLSTGINCGQVRGPVQLAFARSVEPVHAMEVSITRMAATNDKEAEQRRDGEDEKRGDKRTMGRKYIIPYGLYRAHGFVSAPLASHPVKGTGFDEADATLLFEAFDRMFEHDRSAARGEMAKRRLIVFRHGSALGSAPAHSLFERVTTYRRQADTEYPVGDPRTHNWSPARAFSDYRIDVDTNGLPDGVEIVEM
jgi:CRISPR-associated protein Csd2